MSRIPCNICLVPCTWCRGVCKCWMKDFQAKISNNILSNYPEWFWEKSKLDKLVSLVLINTPEHLIIESIENNTEVKKAKPESKSLYWFCEYPIGSIWQWAWIKCINCWKERFYWLWKPCINIKINNKTLSKKK